jgi:hypothetical protein
MTRENAEWLACMLVASVALVYSLWVVPYIPTGDGPHHILSAHIENHYSDAGSPYPDYYRMLPQFAGKGFALVFTPLESFLPWRAALRTALSICALAFAWGFALVVLALDRSRRPISMLGFVIALPWTLYMGLFPFMVGTTLGLYIVAFVLHRPPTTPVRGVVLALLLLLQGVSHLFTAILTGAIVAVLAIVGAPKGQRLRETGKMALVGAPAAGLLVLMVRERSERPSVQKLLEWFLVGREQEISRWFVPGPGARGWLILLLVIVGIGATFVRARRGTATSTEKALGWLALVFLVLTLFAPVHIPGWQCFAQRFATLATVLGLALLRLPELTPARARAAVPLVTACCIASSLVSARLHRELAQGCADALSGLDAPLHFTGPRLPLVVDPFCGAPRDLALSPVPGSSLALNIPLLYLIDHGGIGANMFTGAPAIHALAFHGSRMPALPAPTALRLARSSLVETDEKLRASVMTELAAEGMPFEGIHLLGGRPTDFEIFKSRGYVTELQSASTFIARFEGCPAELLLPPGALDRELVYVEYGLFSKEFVTAEPRALARMVLPRDLPAVGGKLRVSLPGRPCGALWLRVVWDADASSTLTPGDRTCEQGTWEGRMVTTLTRERPAVQCLPQAAPP